MGEKQKHLKLKLGASHTIYDQMWIQDLCKYL